MKTRRITKQPARGALTDEQVKAVAMMLLERVNQAVETMLETNRSLARAVEKLADSHTIPDGRTVVYLPKPGKP